MLYDYILAHKEQVVDMSIRELSTKAHVSTTVIYSFCEKAKAAGYAEFKLKLRLDLEPSMFVQRLGTGSQVLDTLWTLEADQHNQMGQAVALLKQAGNITFIGVGMSGILAKYGSICFSNYGIASRYIADAYFHMPVNSEDDVVIALSASGETNEMIHRINRFKEMNVPVVSITNSAGNTKPTSTIARLATVSLTYHVPEETYLEPRTKGDTPITVVSHVPVMFILEKLAKQLRHQA